MIILEEKGLSLEIVYFEKLNSTHKFLLKKLKSGEFKSPVMIVAKNQEDGVGTHENKWISLEENLFISFSILKDDLASDLELQSLSIYFAYLLKEVLEEKGSKVWLKWPNDFYINDKKIGGVLSTIVGKNIVCSFGLNIKKAPSDFEVLDINIEKNELIKLFILNLKSKKSWKGIFKKYKVEFEKSREFSVRVENEKKSLEKASLLKDGSIKIENKKVYSTR